MFHVVFFLCDEVIFNIFCGFRAIIVFPDTEYYKNIFIFFTYVLYIII